MIVDASVLILYAKINQLNLIPAVYKPVIIAEEVYKEVVVRGEGFPDSAIVKESIRKKKIEIKYLNEKYAALAAMLVSSYHVLDAGEAETIALALQENEKELLVDDEAAYATARLYGLAPYGSLRVLLEAYRKKIITSEQVFFLLRELIEAGLWISARVLDRFYELFRQLEKKH